MRKKRKSANQYRELELKPIDNKKIRRKIYIKISLFIMALFLIMGGVSYAFYTLTVSGNKKVEIVAGEFKINFKDGNTINLNNTIPMSDKEGMLTDEYQFSIKNEGNVDARYNVGLEEENITENTLDKKYIKYSIKEGDGEWSSPQPLSNGLMIRNERLLNKGEKIDYKIKMWLVEDADNIVQGKTFSTKIVVSAVQSNVNVEDHIAPVINISNPYIMIKQGEAFIEPEPYEIKDNEDNDIKINSVSKTYEYYDGENISEVSEVDTNRIGVYYIYYRVTDRKGNTGCTVVSVNVNADGKDNIPTIKLNGESNKEIKKGEIYEELGAEAEDIEDGILTNKIITIGQVNTNVYGNYTIRYIVVDSSGNITSVARNITVVEKGNIKITPGEITNSEGKYKIPVNIKVIDGELESYYFSDKNEKPVSRDYTKVEEKTSEYNKTFEVNKTGTYYIWAIDTNNNVESQKIDVGSTSTSTNLLVAKNVIELEVSEEEKIEVTGNTGDLVYEADNDNCSVDDSGNVIGNKVGETTVVITDTETGESVTVKVHIYKNIHISYEKNGIGVSSVGNLTDDNTKCKLTYKNTEFCEVTLPNMEVIDDYIALGWSQNSQAKTIIDSSDPSALNGYQEVSKKVSVSADTTYYSISKKEGDTYTATFTKNGKGIKSISSTILSCSTDIYNNETESNSCTVDAPSIDMENGYTGYGWSDEAQLKIKYVTMDFIEGNYRCVYDVKANQFISSTNISTGAPVDGLYQHLNGMITTNNVTTAEEAIDMYKKFFGEGKLTYDINYDVDYIAPKNEITLTKNTTYYTVSKKDSVDVTYHFMPNGIPGDEIVRTCILKEAWNNENQSDICTLAYFGVYRPGYTVLGYSKNKDAHSIDDKDDLPFSTLVGGPRFQVKYNGDNDVYYYAITTRNINVNWDGNDSTITSTTSSCTIYNTESECIITSPSIERDGFNIIGFSKNENATADEQDIWKANTPKNVTIRDDGSTYFAITSSTREAVIHYYDSTSNQYEKVNVTCDIYGSNDFCSYTIPEEVINSEGPNGFKYRGLAKQENSDEIVNIVNSNNKDYYAVYSEDVDISIAYYDGSNQNISTVSSHNNALANDNNYVIKNSIINVPDVVINSTGTDNSSYIGLSIATSNSDVVETITTKNLFYYAVYEGTWAVDYIKDDNSVSSIGSTTDVCSFYQTSNGTEYNMSENYCNKELPSITIINDSYYQPYWYEDDTKVGKPSENYVIDKNKTLIAKATIKSVVVSYDCSTNGGICEVDSEKIPYGGSANLSYEASKTGYDFVGWNTQQDSKVKLAELDNITSDTKLYAIYKKSAPISLNSKTIQYNGEKVFANEAVLSNELEGLDVTYKYYNDSSCNDEISVPIDAGEYYVQASVTNDGQDIKSHCTSHTITPRIITASWGNTHMVYNKEEQAPSYKLNNTLDSEELELKQSKKIDSGNYTSVITLLSVIGGRGNKDNYKLVNNSSKYTISPADGYVRLSSYNELLNHGIDSISFSILETHGGEISIENLTDFDISIDRDGSLVTLSNLNKLKRGSSLRLKVTSSATDNYYSAYAYYDLYIKSPASIGDAVAKIENEYYATLEEALDDAKPSGDTIEMLKNTTESVVNIKDVTIDLGGTTITGLNDNTITNNGTLKIINSGTIENKKDTVLINNGTLTLGEDDDEVSQGYPYISGIHSGIEQNGIYNFYDGLIYAEKGIVGSVNDKPINYYVFVDHDATNNYQRVYLVNQLSNAVVKSIPVDPSIAEIYYFNLQDAFNSYTSSVEELVALRDFEAAYQLSILKGQDIKLDISGYTVSTGYTITNDGILTLVDTGQNKGSLQSSVAITNNNTLKLENITINETTNSNVIENNGTLELSNSYINATSGSGVMDYGNIVADDKSIVKSASNCALIINKENYVLNGGHFESTKNSFGVCVRKSATINNVNITGANGLSNISNVKINDASINVSGTGIQNNSTMIIDNATVNAWIAIGSIGNVNLTVNDGLYHSSNYAYEGDDIHGSVNLLGGTYTSDGSDAIYCRESSYSNKRYLHLTIGSETSIPIITSTASNAIKLSNIYGTVVNNGVINGKINGIYNSSTKLSIYGGEISGENYGIYNSYNDLTIGNEAANNATNHNPTIIGKTYGIYIENSYMQMYSGIVKGQTDAIYGEVSKVLNGYKVVYDNEEIESLPYKIAYLNKASEYLKVGDNYYRTLEEAIASINGEGTITVIESESDSSNASISSTKNITLDLNGNTIEIGNKIENAGSFTICDSSSDKSGKIVMKSVDYIVDSSADSTLLVKSGNFESPRSGFSSKNGDIIIENANINAKLYSIYSSYGNVTINDGNYSNISCHESNMTIINGNFSENIIFSSANVNVKGKIENATVDGKLNIIGPNSDSDFVIDNININTKDTAISNSGLNLTINSGTIISENSYGIYCTNGGNIVIGNDDGTMNENNPVIIGGTYGLYNVSSYKKTKIFFYDGILKGKIAGSYGSITEISDDYLLKTGEEIINGENYSTAYLEKQRDFLMVDGNTYRSFEDAINAISSEGTITVLEDYIVTESVVFPSDKTVTIDLSSHTLNFINSVTNQGDLIVNSDNQGGGQLSFTGLGDYECIKSTKDITINNVDIKTDGTGSLLSISGKGKFIGGNYSFVDNLSGYVIVTSASSEVEIDGTTITGNKGIENNGYTKIKNAHISTYNNSIINREKGLVDIIDGDYTSSNAQVIYSLGSINIGSDTTNPTITSVDVYQQAIYSVTTLNLYSGIITSPGNGITIGDGTLNIGNKNNEVNINTPLIMANGRAVTKADGHINYYDGILKELAYQTVIDNVVSNYRVVESTEVIGNNTYYVTSLAPSVDFINNGDKAYSDLRTAITEAENGDVLTLTDDSSIWYKINIPSGKEITIDLAGHHLSLLNNLVNNGTLTINDSAVKVGSIVTKKINYSEIENLGVFNINNSVINIKINNGNQNFKNINANMTLNNAIINGGISNYYSNCEIIDSLINIEYTGTYISNGNNSNMEISGSSINNSSSYSSPTSITNGGELTIDSTNMTSRGAPTISNGKNITMTNSSIENSRDAIFLREKSNMTIENTSIDISMANAESYAIRLDAGSTLIADHLDITMNTKKGYGIKGSGSDDTVLKNTNITIEASSEGIGIYSNGNGTIAFETGKINVYSPSSYAYGIYIKTGTVVMGIKDGDGTENATVSTINPEVKATHSHSWGKSYGVKKENGYFKYYDGKIIGSTNAKPETTTEVEYNYEAIFSRNEEGYEECILKYMK